MLRLLIKLVYIRTSIWISVYTTNWLYAFLFPFFCLFFCFLLFVYVFLFSFKQSFKSISFFLYGKAALKLRTHISVTALSEHFSTLKLIASQEKINLRGGRNFCQTWKTFFQTDQKTRPFYCDNTYFLHATTKHLD